MAWRRWDTRHDYWTMDTRTGEIRNQLPSNADGNCDEPIDRPVKRTTRQQVHKIAVTTSIMPCGILLVIFIRASVSL